MTGAPCRRTVSASASFAANPVCVGTVSAMDGTCSDGAAQERGKRHVLCRRHGKGRHNGTRQRQERHTRGKNSRHTSASAWSQRHSLCAVLPLDVRHARHVGYAAALPPGPPRPCSSRTARSLPTAAARRRQACRRRHSKRQEVDGNRHGTCAAIAVCGHVKGPGSFAWKVRGPWFLVCRDSGRACAL